MNEHHDPLERRLSVHLRAVDAAVLPDAASVTSSVGRVMRRRQGRARIMIGAVSALVVVGAGVALAQRSPTDRAATVPSLEASTPAPVDVSTVMSETVPTTAIAPEAGGWSILPSDPRGVRRDVAVVWTGREALVFGGVDADGVRRDDAAAYDPALQSWRLLADPDPRVGDALVVFVAGRALVIGGQPPAGVVVESSATAFDPQSGVWAAIAGAPAIDGFVTSRSPWAWTGTELLVWPGDAGGAAGSMPIPRPLAYDPALDQWRELPPPPMAPRHQSASVWTGTEWVLWGGLGAAGELADGAAYDPIADAWRVIAASPLSPRIAPGVWTGNELLVYAGYRGGDPVTSNGSLALGDGAAYDPVTDTWRAIASGPAHPGFDPVWTGDQVLLFAKGCVVGYDLAADEWGDSECGGDGPTAWTGDEVLLFGDQLTAFDPSP